MYYVKRVIKPSPWDVRLLDLSKESNLEYFLECTTPAVCINQPMRFHGGECNGARDIASRNPWVPKGFYLQDLWNNLAEWSASGVSVPILLENGLDVVVQYYAPTLSAMQIFTEKPVEAYSYEIDHKASSSKVTNGKSRFNPDRVRAIGSLKKTVDPSGRNLYCEFNETATPYVRVPLTEKIRELAKEYPGVLNFNSADLSPLSWISIAWYPIYQIPAMKNSRDLSACFLTYHSLSSPSYNHQDFAGDQTVKEEAKKGKKVMIPSQERDQKLSLTPFAMATFKLTDTLWKKPGTLDEEIINDKENAAFNWLGSIKFDHNDFTFFMNRKYK